MHYDWPTNIPTDQGKTFESKLIKKLCALAQVHKLHTTSYWPENNGACECFNSTLIKVLGTMPRENKKSWQDWVSTMAHAYNCTVSNATGFKPDFLMCGREPRLSIDIEYGVTLSNLADTTRQNYTQKLESRLKWAFQAAKDFNEKEMNCHKTYYNQCMKCMVLGPDDVVLV